MLYDVLFMRKTYLRSLVGILLGMGLEKPEFSSHWVPFVLSPFRGGGIEYLSDPDSYVGWSFYTPIRASQARQVEG